METNKKILIVDDEETIRIMLQKMLIVEGYPIVHVAQNGAEGIAQHQQMGFDLIITDLKMPKMDGASLIETIRTQDPHVAFIVLTGYGSSDKAYDLLKKHNISDYIDKPVLHNQLLFSVANTFEKQSLVTQLKKEIEAHKITEKELRQKEQMLEAQLMEAIPVGVYMLNSEGLPYYANQKAKELLGKGIVANTSINQLSETYQAYIQGTDIPYPPSQMPIVQALSGNKTSIQDIEIRQTDKTILLEVHGTPVYNGKQQLEYAIAVFQDITERKQAEKELIENEEKFRKLVENIPVLINAFDEEGNYIFWNKACEDVTEYTAKEMCHSPEALNKLYPDPNYLQELMAEWRKRENTFHNWEITLTSKSGKQKIVAWTNISDHIPIPGWAAWAIGVDVSHQRKLEHQLQQSQKLELMGTLAGGIAHDLNNILVPIVGFAHRLLEKSNLHPTEHDYLNRITQASNRAKDLVNQILAFSRKSESHKAMVGMADIVKDSFKLVRATIPSTIELEEQISIGLPDVYADQSQVHQVVMNLVVNSAQAMPKGGVIRVSLYPHETVAKSSDIDKLKHWICLRIQDTGIGMDKVTQERMFEPFFTTKAKSQSSGLGLSVIHGIVTQHGGHIEVESKVGQGTTICVYWLINAQNSAELRGSSQPTLSTTGDARIFFVDDETMVADTAKLLLGEQGYSVIVHLDSVEASEHFKQSPDQFDIAILDYTMPHMTGLELAQVLRQIRPDLPIILCTGYSERVDKSKLSDLNISKCVNKPFEINQLTKLIEQILLSS